MSWKQKILCLVAILYFIAGFWVGPYEIICDSCYNVYKTYGYTDYEIVVAHYNENLKWLKPYKDKVYVYNKGGPKHEEYKYLFKKWENLPNVGREGHSYLTYIIDHYDELPNVIVFLQGKIDDHGVKQNIQTYIAQTLKQDFYATIVRKFPSLEARLEVKRYKEGMKHGDIYPALTSYRDFWLDVFKTPPPEPVFLSSYGCFGVTRALIHKHTKAFYINLLKWVKHHANPEEGYFLEFSWKPIFSSP